ncbi:hypothetical protein D3C84_724870 [compost metagenome]
MDLDTGVDCEAGAGRVQGQVAFRQLIVAGRKLGVAQGNRQQLKLLAVEHQRRQARATGRIAAHDQLRMDQAVVLEQLEGQVRLVDQVLGRLIVLQVNHLRLFGAHAGILLLGHA